MNASLSDFTILEADAAELQQQLTHGNVTAREMAALTLAKIERDNPTLHAFTHVFADQALASATDSDLRRSRDALRGPLDGVPLAVKANLAVAGWPQHAGLAFRREAVVSDDAFVIGKLRAAGAVLLGLTNMDAGALGATGRNAAFGDVTNPRAPGVTTGGSSAGSAAALAAKLTTLAIGTDTIGSVRIPSAYCGIAALKPTSGAISTRGVIATHQRFDHVGPMARSMRDLATLFKVLVGWDRQCRVSFPLTFQPLRPATTPSRVGFVTGFDTLEPDSATLDGYNRAIAALRAAGHALVPVDSTQWGLPRVARAIFALCEIEMARAHASRLEASPGDFSPALLGLLEFGRRQRNADMQRFEARIAALVASTLQAFSQFDYLLAPTTPTTAFLHGSPQVEHSAAFTCIASATGRPSVAIPVHSAPDALPASVQLIGQPGDDYNVLSLAQSLEAAIS